MIRTVLNHQQWERIAPELPGKVGDPGVTARDNRLFVEAVLWIARTALWASLALAGVGLPLLLLPYLAVVVLGMVLIGVGTFFAQATATGFVSRAATADRGSASGIYLACYFAGGLIGTAILGQMFDRIGWPACVGGIALSLGIAALLALCLKHPDN